MDKDNFYTKFFQKYLPFILSGLLICAVLLSTSTLIVKYELSILDLLFINTCIVGEIIAIFALLFRNKFYLNHMGFKVNYPLLNAVH